MRARTCLYNGCSELGGEKPALVNRAGAAEDRRDYCLRMVFTPPT